MSYFVAHPCLTNNGGCQQDCTTNNGTVECSCTTGTLNADGQNCDPGRVHQQMLYRTTKLCILI